MNKVYQVIWSRVKNSYVVVSELAGTSHKKKRSVSIRAISLAAFLAMSMTAPAVEAAEPYTILVDGKGNIVSAETDLSGTGEQFSRTASQVAYTASPSEKVQKQKEIILQQ